MIKPRVLVTEDSNLGNQFFKAVVEGTNIICRSAGGKSNIFAEAAKMIHDYPDEMILVIADGAAFGAEMEKMVRLILEQNN